MHEMPMFTAGPWKVEKSETHKIFWVQAPFEGVCDLYIRINDGTFSPFRNAEANANLIAAAPDLYEALRRLDEFGHTEATWDFAKRALAKARGEA